MFALGLFMLSCMIQSSFALKCFTCESVSNRLCADLSDKNVFQPQECVAESILSQGAGFFSQLGLGGNSNNANKDPLIPTCLKVVTRNGTGTVVARRCAVKYQNQDPCTLARNAAQQTGVNAQFEFCGACDVDACNSASSMQLFYVLTIFAAMVSTARLFV